MRDSGSPPDGVHLRMAFVFGRVWRPVRSRLAFDKAVMEWAACFDWSEKQARAKKFSRVLLGVGDGALDRVLCVIGTIAFSQVPEFIQQYLQRLGGHLDEARRQLAQFRNVAKQSGLTLERLISQTDANADPAVAKLGGVMTSEITRVEELQVAQTAIQGASAWERPFVFLRNMDSDIARATWSIFKPAVPTTIEGLCYAVLGMVVLLAIYHGGVLYPISRVARRSKQRSPVPVY